MKERKILTVVVPIYNSELYLENCLSNLNKMIGDFKNSVEVLLINDGSTDNSLQYLKCKTKDLTEYKVIDKPHTGVSDTRNYGIKNATGKYITFLDSDDSYKKDFISHFLLEIKNEPDIVWNDVINIKNNYFLEIKNDDIRLSLMEMVLGITKQKIQEGIASKFYKLSFLKENELVFNSKVVISEDTLFILQALAKAQSIYLSNRQFYFILNEHSLNRFNPKTLEGELEYRNQVAIILRNYKESKIKRLIDDRTKINGFCTLIYRYFGPLIENKKMTVNQAAERLKEIAKDSQYINAFGNGKLDHTVTMRYKLFRILLSSEKYKLVLEIDVLIDKLKRTNWNIIE